MLKPWTVVASGEMVDSVSENDGEMLKHLGHCKKE